MSFEQFVVDQALNDVALHIGEMVAAGWIGREAVEAALFKASRFNGYLAKKADAGRATLATLQSGLAAGMKNPRPPFTTAKVATEALGPVVSALRFQILIVLTALAFPLFAAMKRLVPQKPVRSHA